VCQRAVGIYHKDRASIGVMIYAALNAAPSRDYTGLTCSLIVDISPLLCR
jgi:hypothetical protein